MLGYCTLHSVVSLPFPGCPFGGFPLVALAVLWLPVVLRFSGYQLPKREARVQLVEQQILVNRVSCAAACLAVVLCADAMG